MKPFNPPDSHIVEIIPVRGDGVVTRIECRDKSVYIDNGKGQLLNPAKTVRGKAAVKAHKKARRLAR